MIGEVAVRVEGGPVDFLGYWRDEESTAAKVHGGWPHAGDLAEVDADDASSRQTTRSASRS